MTQTNNNIEVQSVASFSDILQNENWGPEIKRAVDADSIAFIEPSEQPAPTPRSSPRPR